MKGITFGRGQALPADEKPAPTFPDEPASGVRLAAPASGFIVQFEDGHEETFDCVLDAHQRMNRARGALRTVNAATGNTTAVPVPFGYGALWNGREPGWSDT